MVIQLILKTCDCTQEQGGIIVFLQSYGYKTLFVNFLNAHSDYEKLTMRRKVYEESKEGPDVFIEYQKEIQVRKGSALLFCVIGGKLSEGINFSDDLARTVIVCGLPFANSQSLEIQEKMKYFDKVGDPQFRGADYYENQCMKTLNQSIGRAIRHINDYATIILLDQRFTNKGIQKKLPKWIQSRIIEVGKTAGCASELQQVATLMINFFKYFD